MLTLTVYRGDRIVQELDLDGPEIGIGRNADNTVVLPDDGRGVSRAHAVLRVENGSHVLYDRDSQNGTFLEGKRVKRAVVQPGQDIVIGPYRLVLSSVEAAGAVPGPTGTVVASRTTMPPTPPAAAAPLPEATPADIAPAQAPSTPAKGSRTAVTPAGKPIAQVGGFRPSRPVLYGAAGVGIVVLAAVLIWRLWPAPPDTDALVTLTTTPTTSVTTTVPAPPPDPHAERIAEAESAMAVAEEAFASKRYTTAAAAFDRVAASLAPGLMADPQPPQASELRERAVARATEARQLAALAKVPAPVPKPVDPNAVAPRPDESERDYDRRNKEAQQDYAHARRLLAERDYMGAITIFEGLAKREPGWLDVSTFLKNAQDALAQDRKSALDEGLRRENGGYNALNERRFADAARELIAASKAFERAVALQAPTAEKLASENLARRRQLAKAALDSARTHANNRQFNEAVERYQAVIDVLPSGDQLRLLAEVELKKIAPGRD